MTEAAPPFVLPRIPASAGALIFDDAGRLLVVNPTYKAHWTVPGGIMEADGETPWEACRREVHEEVGLVVEHGGPHEVVAGGEGFVGQGGHGCDLHKVGAKDALRQPG